MRVLLQMVQRGVKFTPLQLLWVNARHRQTVSTSTNRVQTYFSYCFKYVNYYFDIFEVVLVDL
jgi:hypothetical protein